MPDFTDGIDFTATDPFTATLRAAERKLTKRETGYPSKALLSWCDERGGLHVFTFRGEQPRIVVPAPSECPAILILAANAPPIDAPYNSTAAREVFFTLDFTGWLYTDDQEEAFRFWWLFLAAISKPYLKNDFDEFYGPGKVQNLEAYWAGPPSFTPWGRSEERLDGYVWSTDLTFRYALDLFR